MLRRQSIPPGRQPYHADLHLGFLAVEHGSLARQQLGTKALIWEDLAPQEKTFTDRPLVLRMECPSALFPNRGLSDR
jgi:hypothetical protein